MQILISCAKTMGNSTLHIETTTPTFIADAEKTASVLSALSEEELSKELKIKGNIIKEVREKYANFGFAQPQPALLAYQGIVFKHIAPSSFDNETLQFANNHLFITSFLYGLLRPFDGIKTYRLEGNAKLNGVSRFNFWKDKLTDFLIDSVKADDGILVNLASGEMKKLFDWKKVCKALNVIDIDFKVERNGSFKSLATYAKILRGDMVKYILENKIDKVEDLGKFTPCIEGETIKMFI